MKQMNSEQYVMCSDTSQDYLGNGYNSRNENTKGEVEQNMTHKTKVTYKTRHLKLIQKTLRPVISAGKSKENGTHVFNTSKP